MMASSKQCTNLVSLCSLAGTKIAYKKNQVVQQPPVKHDLHFRGLNGTLYDITAVVLIFVCVCDIACFTFADLVLTLVW